MTNQIDTALSDMYNLCTYFIHTYHAHCTFKEVRREEVEGKHTTFEHRGQRATS